MGWATAHMARLRAGETIQFRPKGHSMSGRIESGQKVTVEPASADSVAAGDIVLCRVGGSDFLHLVKARGPDGALLIGNNRGKTNGWTRAVFGRVTKVEA